MGHAATIVENLKILNANSDVIVDVARKMHEAKDHVSMTNLFLALREPLQLKSSSYDLEYGEVLRNILFSNGWS